MYSIAEMILSRASIGAWDNSTRGLDAATALEFVRALSISAKLTGSCHAVAAYQASEALYNTFDQVILLYEGREVYFGNREGAVSYFEKMGWKRPLRQVSADFLTAITNPGERQPQPGMEDTVPRTPAEFEAYWKKSTEYANLKTSMREYKQNHPLNGSAETQLNRTKRAEQAAHVRPSSSYLLSMPMQVRLCMTRAWQRTRNDVPALVATAVAQIVVSIIIGSLFYDIPNNTSGMGQRASVLFLAVLTNALISMLEINILYAQRPIVEKQAAYAFVHPFSEAIAGVIVDFPVKLVRCVLSAIIIYFFANLRREPSHFFVYILFQLTAVITMAAMFRTLATITRTIGQAMSLAGVTIICVAVYTGFTVPQFDMRPWFGWIRWLNPIFYAYEGIVSNEFHGRRFDCMNFIPSSNFHQGQSFTCAYVGSVPGQGYVSGDAYIAASYDYSYAHIWRNYGILVAFLVFFYVLYFSLTELIPGTKPAHEVLIFRNEQIARQSSEKDLETGRTLLPSQELRSESTAAFPSVTEGKDTLFWKGVCYDIPIEGGEKRLLDDVSGWVKPGSLTALMVCDILGHNSTTVNLQTAISI
jgi:ATP-binding cassette subfamily G (WHITE) protein 2 (PDR)